MIPAAWPFVLSPLALGILIWVLGAPLAGGLLLVLAACLALFFRDPERTIPPGEHQIVAPADGKVVEVSPESGEAPGRIAIFLSLLNVHVNRAPVAGTVSNVTYTPGAFKAAFRREASTVNERNTLEISAPGGTFSVSQIAGVVARRIHCHKKKGDQVVRGERFGYIAFGSRTELTVPPGTEIVVQAGDTVRGGETVVARYQGAPGALE